MGKCISIFAPFVILFLLAGTCSVDEALASAVNTQTQSVSNTETSNQNKGSVHTGKQSQGAIQKSKKTKLRVTKKKTGSTQSAAIVRTHTRKANHTRILRRHSHTKIATKSTTEVISPTTTNPDREAYAPLDFWLARALDEQARQRLSDARMPSQTMEADSGRGTWAPYHYRGNLGTGTEVIPEPPLPSDNHWLALSIPDRTGEGPYSLVSGPGACRTGAEMVLTTESGREGDEHRDTLNADVEAELTDLWPVIALQSPGGERDDTQAEGGMAFKILETAYNYLGVRYRYGGSTPEGFDCSGFVRYVFSENGIQLGRSSRDQAQAGMHVPLSALKPGDLIFFSMRSRKHHRIDHVGLYIGDGQFIHAASSRSRQIMISDLKSVHYQNRVVTARRVLSSSP